MKLRLTFTLVMTFGLALASVSTAYGQSRTTRSGNTAKTRIASTKGTAPVAAKVLSSRQISSEAKNHFKGMKYNYSERKGVTTGNKAVESIKGGATVRLKGKSVQINWYMTTDSKGGVVHMYVGDSEMTGFGSLGVARGEHGRRMEGCLAKEGEARKNCLNRLWIETTTDCLLSGNDKRQCRIDCWYRGGYCFPDK